MVKVGVFKHDELRDWLREAGMKDWLYRPFSVESAEVTRLHREAELQHPGESLAKIRARSVGRALALKLSREARTREAGIREQTFKPVPWNWAAVIDWGFRIVVIVLLLLILLFGIPLRSHAQSRSLRVQVQDEGTIVTSRGAGNLLIFDCTGAGVTCSLVSGKLDINVTGGGATGYQTVEDEGIGLTQRTILNFLGAGVNCVDNVTKTDCTISGGGSPTLDVIQDAAGANTLANADNAQVWNWILTTADKSAFTFGETTASTATGNPVLINVQTLAASTAHPFQVTARGTANGVRVGATDGLVVALGTGGLDWPALLNYPAACTNQFIRAILDTPTCATVTSTDTSGTFPPDTEALAFTDLSDIASTSGSGTVGLLGTSPTILTSLNVGAAGANNILLQVDATTQMIFEGSVADAAETEFRVTNCTDTGADCLVTFPDADSTTVQPDTGAASNFLTAISTTGVISKAQPAFTDVSGTAAAGQVPNLENLNGTLNGAQLDQTDNYTWTGQHDYDTAEILSAIPIRFEGLTDDNIYTTITITDPTVGRTFTLPNADSNSVQPTTCGGTDKVSAISALGVITCDTDQTAGGAFWEAITNSANTPTLYTGDDNAETFTINFTSNWGTDRITFSQGAGNPTGGSLVTISYTDTDIDALTISDGTDTLVANSGDMGVLSLFPTGSAEIHATEVLINVEKGSAGTITAGQVVYQSGFDAVDNVIEVELADSDAAGTMPAIGVAQQTITDTVAGHIVAFGTLININTSAFSVGDDLYVSGTAGDLTATKPIGTALVQKVAQVGRSHVSLGVIEVFGAGRSNDLPNIANDNIWIGDGSGVPAASIITDCVDTGGNHLNYTQSTNAFSCGTSLPSTVVETDQSNTYSAGDQSFASASSLTVPTVAGAAPTSSGDIRYDTTSNTYEYGDDGVNRLVANLDEAQTFDLKTLTNTVFVESNAADPAESGVIRVGNAEDFVCAESAPTGTDICVQLDAAENWQFDNDLAWLSGTAFQGIFAHANTAARTYTLGDRDMTVAAVSGSPATGNCAEFDANDDLVDAGAACGGSDGVGYDEILDEAVARTKRAQVNFIGGGVSCVDNPGATRTDCTIAGGGATTLDTVTAAAGGVTIANADFANVWNWFLTTASKSAFTFGETTASTATGTPILINIQTLAASTANPLQVTARGTANGIRVGATDGVLDAIGTGGLDWAALLNYPTACSAQFVRAILDTPTCETVSLTADVSGILPGANGGTGNGFFAVSGPASTLKTFTFPNASATVLTDNAAVTVAQGGTGITSGTSGGIPFFSATTTIASSALLDANELIVGGGAGVAPSTPIGLGTTTTVLHGNAGGAPSFSAVVLTTDISGILPNANGGMGIDTSGSTGVARIDSGTTSVSELSGDVTTSGSNVTAIAAGVVASAELATANKTLPTSIALIDPTTAEDDKVQWMYGTAVTFTDVDCSTDTGTVTIDMDHRVITTPNTVGTDILTGTIVCDTNNQPDGGFADATIPANVPVNLSITATSGSPGTVRIFIRYTVD